MSERSARLLALFNHTPEGQWPFAGAMADQPAIVVEAFQLITWALSEYQKREAKAKHHG